MKNFYEILEINKNASQEIVEKAYKVLAKKYHPDLQTDPNEKQKNEEKIKELNEAYETISNTELRAKYDAMLEEENRKKELLEKAKLIHQVRQEQQRQAQQNQQSNVSKPTNAYNSANTQSQYNNAVQYNVPNEQIERQFTDAINRAYNNAYIEDLKNRGYKIKYKKTPKEYLTSLIALLITILIVILVAQIPFVKKLLHDFYEDNTIIKHIVDTIVNYFKNN